MRCTPAEQLPPCEVGAIPTKFGADMVSTVVLNRVLRADLSSSRETDGDTSNDESYLKRAA